MSDRLRTLRDEAVGHAERGDYDKAASFFKEAVHLDPSCAALHEQLAQCLAELERYSEAEEAAANCTALEPQWAEGWLTHARIELSRGHIGRACQSFHTSMAHAGQPEGHAIREELHEAEALWEQQVARRVGLPGLRIQQRLGSRAGPGAVVWESGLCLAEHLCTHCRSWLPGKVLLELGSGTGIVGITAAKLGGEVTLSDRQSMLSLLSENTRRNAIKGRTELLEWETPNPAVESTAYEVILIADPVYSSSQVPALEAVLRRLWQKNPACRLLLAHKHRHDDVDNRLFEAIAQLQLALRQVAVSAADTRVKVYDSAQ